MVTCGGVNSNHCRATSYLAKQLGLDVHLFLRTPDGQPPAVQQSNTLMNKIAGADIHWIDPSAYLDRDQLLGDFSADQAKRGKKVFVIPDRPRFG